MVFARGLAYHPRVARATGTILRSGRARALAMAWSIALGCGANPRRLADARIMGREAVRLHRLGLTDDALAAANGALRIRENELGPDHPEVAIALNNLGTILEAVGRYGEAEAAFVRALRILRSERGGEETRLATTLSNLGGVLVATQAFDRAEVVLEEAVRILRARRSDDDPDLAVALNNLAAAYVSNGDLDRAEPIYRRVIATLERIRGADDPEVATALGNLAQLLQRRGDARGALPFAQRSLEIRVNALGADHPETALALNNLAALIARTGDTERAERLLVRATQSFERRLHPGHPYVATTLENLADLHASLGAVQSATNELRRAIEITEQVVRVLRLTTSEERLSHYLEALRRREAMVFTLLARNPGNSALRELAASVAMLRKGRAIDESAEVLRFARRARGEDSTTDLDALRDVRARIASLALGEVAMQAADRARSLHELERRAEVLELGLVRRSAGERAARQLPGLGEILPAVAARIPSGGALVEYVAFREHAFLSSDTSRGAVRFLALVISRGGAVRAVDLGPGDSISTSVRAFLGAVRSSRGNVEPSAADLHRRLVVPLQLDASLRRLLIVPDGDLNLIPFAPLGDRGSALIDRFEIGYLTSGRDLLRNAEGAEVEDVVVFADPAFGGAPEAVAAPSRGFLTNRIPALPGTRREAEAIHGLFTEAVVHLGEAATEARLLGVTHPAVLHVATHGLFVEDPATGEDEQRGFVAQPSSSPAPAGAESAEPELQNPLTRSALVLAGAASRAGLRGDEDGLVTALEAATMDLDGTELVVLSACDSGRGAIGIGDGVYGLRRALVIAGAQTLVTSLWRVDDDATRDLMTAYYSRLAAGSPRGAALREASRALRARRPHPYFWAPFVSIGADGPLSAATLRHVRGGA